MEAKCPEIVFFLKKVCKNFFLKRIGLPLRPQKSGLIVCKSADLLRFSSEIFRKPEKVKRI